MKEPTLIDNDLMKILVIGANGFLGSQYFSYNNKEINTDDVSFIAADLYQTNLDPNIPFYNIDITDEKEVFRNLNTINPDIVLLSAAMTNVDLCEMQKELASKINTQGPINIVKACEKINCKLVFVSTDFVFDGRREIGRYTEKDCPNPLSYYGKTKLAAELAIKASEAEYLICRTAVLYGWNKERLNFITWVIHELRKKNEIRIVTDQINNATFAPNLSHMIIKLIQKGAKGIYHTAGKTPLNRYQMALKCAEIFNLNKNLIVPIDHFEQITSRPKNAALSVEKIQEKIGSELKIFDLEDGLKYMKKYEK